ncbi:MAG: hypothetical protein E7812_15180 [Phenylobacterium sp.]|nr:MAG: hypothetical protein E7812_15180 [Phenylobacterium sp.]
MILAILAAATVSTAPADVSNLGWMAGAWSETKHGVTVRETWLAPLGGGMAGAAQTNRPGRPPTYEFSSISTDAAGVVSFNPFMRDKPPTPFALLPGPDGQAVFQRPGDDFPQRVIYRRCGADLCARIEGQVNGQLKGQDWRYHRVRP